MVTLTPEDIAAGEQAFSQHQAQEMWGVLIGIASRQSGGIDDTPEKIERSAMLHEARSCVRAITAKQPWYLALNPSKGRHV